ncbi:MAG: class I SAM-dependent methyltransferase [Methanomassiliicoccales archaeon]
MSNMEALTTWLLEMRDLPSFSLNCDGRRYREHWDALSRIISPEAGEHDVEVVRHLVRRGALRKGDQVLDIGCGPGTHALLFAKVADQVTALDFSPGMLRQLERAAELQGIRNLRMECSAWEDFEPARTYDLVFSSFCPAVLEPGSIIRMESLSRRSCCLVSHMGGSRDPYVALLSHLAGKDLTLHGLDIRFPLAFLRELGREPILVTVEVETSFDASSLDKETLRSYLHCFKEVEDVRCEEVETAVRRRLLQTGSKLVMGVLIWERPSVLERNVSCREPEEWRCRD